MTLKNILDKNLENSTATSSGITEAVQAMIKFSKTIDSELDLTDRSVEPVTVGNWIIVGWFVVKNDMFHLMYNLPNEILNVGVTRIPETYSKNIGWINPAIGKSISVEDFKEHYGIIHQTYNGKIPYQF